MYVSFFFITFASNTDLYSPPIDGLRETTPSVWMHCLTLA